MPAAATGTRVTLDELVALRAAIGAQRWRQASVARPGPAGAHLSADGGRGMEFADSRPYQSGDDVRAIDWRQTARRGKPFTKLFHEERERPVWLLCDLGPSMRFGSRVAFKSVLAARATALLAWQAAATGDRVGGGGLGTLPGGPVQAGLSGRTATGYAVEPARRGRDGVLALLRRLADADHGVAAPTVGDFASALAALGALQRPGGRLIVLSDFAVLDGAAEPLRDALRASARHQSISLVHVVDRLEVVPPPPGRYAFAGLDGTRWLDLADPPTRDAWGAPYRARRTALAKLAGELAATQLELFTDQPAERVLVLGSNGPLSASPRPRMPT
jgi:uncharacterized protein (DUF58 family)